MLIRLDLQPTTGGSCQGEGGQGLASRHLCPSGKGELVDNLLLHRDVSTDSAVKGLGFKTKWLNPGSGPGPMWCLSCRKDSPGQATSEGHVSGKGLA